MHHSRGTFTFLRSLLAGSALLPAMAGAIDLADSPLFSTVSVPGNLILALSVEWPTATTPAYPSTTAYSSASTFLGYFDPDKCYLYVPVNTGSDSKPDYSTSYFRPYGAARDHRCNGSANTPLWSGNYLNWASMQTLDAFRWVLTGGYRSVDTATTTVLTKTNALKESASMPEKTLAAASLDGAVPFDSSKWTAGAVTRLRNLGTRMWITGNVSGNGEGLVTGKATTGAVPYTGQTTSGNPSSGDYANPNRTYELYINVKVCDSGAGLEDNCVAYGSGHKPEGLMQKYASRLRYSAFGYYNDDSTQRDGGVMRARMKYIGPTQPVPGSTPVGNSHAEWDSATGVMVVNPDPDDIASTKSLAASFGFSVSLSNSGVMNYLNKFGYASTKYKSVDPVSELYYAALRYYKNQGNVRTYTSLAGAGDAATAAAWLDGFPAIADNDVWKKAMDSDDAAYGSPMLYSCQKNFILGIGDANSWRDGNLPGSTLTAQEPAQPAEVSSDKSVDAKKATDMVGQLEGVSGGALGGRYADRTGTSCDRSARCNTFLMAGLAYDAHTRDIRADLEGMQTVNTYWMDVLENQVYRHKNPFWLAAKYGGFTVPEGFSPYAGSNGTATLDEDTWHSNTDTLVIGDRSGTLNFSTDSKDGTDKRPDNFFPGNQPDAMKTGLTKAFAKIVSETDQATGTALATPTPNTGSSGTTNFAASYDPKDWTGELAATTLTFDTNGVPANTGLWKASTLLDAMVTNTVTSARKIVTCCTSAGTALPFTAEALSGANLHARTNYASFSNVPGVTDQSAADFVAYLRGARGQELANHGKYRTRSHLLGDIVNSKLAVVGPPNAAFHDVANPGYSSFKRLRSDRQTVVYAGANDGMLHAFDGRASADDGGGKELFAYIPSFLYGSSSTAATSGLAALGNPSYSHHYYVDATPQVFDLDFARAATSQATTRQDWRSLLIGGLGKGGKGYYAIDVTNPADWTSESAVAGKVLWEFADSRLGYTYGAASVVKTRKYGWVAVFTSGYNNADGKGYFFFVNPTNGELLEAVATPEGSTAAPINLAHHTAFIPDYTDFTADAVYAADMQGNVWRLDVTGTGAYGTPVKIARLGNANREAQPATTRPLVEIEPNSKKRYVMIGTGRLLADSDISSGSRQSFYAIVDGLGSFGGFFANGSDSTGFPFTRENLEANTNLLTGIGSKPASPLGWYFDLAVDNKGIAERVDVQSVANNGLVAFAANLPNGNTCSPSGTGRTFTVDFSTGQTVLTNADGTQLVASMASGSVIREVSFIRTAGKVRVYAGTADGSIVKVPTGRAGDGSFKQLTWREVRATD